VGALLAQRTERLIEQRLGHSLLCGVAGRGTSRW
jgi:hypothetical protein